MAASGTVSSGSWRKGLMRQSIASFFNNREDPEKNDQAVVSESARHESTATSSSGGVLGGTTPTPEGGKNGPTGDDPMANKHVENGVEYKSMAWWQAGMVMVAETISLGILALPYAMSKIGIIPGLILLLALGAMASYSGYVIGQFKQRFRHIHSMAGAGEVLFGRWGREILGWGQFLFYLFIMGSHILTFSIMMNAITDHGSCTIVWMVVGTILSLACTLPRTLKNLSYYSVASFLSIIGAVMITMIGVSITKPGFVNGHMSVRLWPQPGLSFQDGFQAVNTMVFAYAGHVAFFTFISELRNPDDFPKALAFLQCSDISMYIITAIVVYLYAGENVRSPALDSASTVVKKVAYGIAIPTIVIAGVVNGHVGVKYVYVRMLQHNKDDLMHRPLRPLRVRTDGVPSGWNWLGIRSYGIWVLICTLSWLAAWVIAESVPVFGDLVGLTSALFASWFTFGLSGMFWMRLNLLQEEGSRLKMIPVRFWTWRKALLFLVNTLNILVAAILCFVGIYSSISSMIKNGAAKKPWSCAA
ncbi:hypothetical protein LTR96_000193 [Exophiala xenobiotica]|nr:hypothetical protein LTR96_000193 [Exophiala xenobiotica]KAK5338189.1 hypothetical protein LTR98_006038 [Exophiala xenobiotica]